MNVVSNLLASALLKRGSQIAKPPLRAAAAGTEVAKSSAKAPARGSAARRPRREERVDENGSQLPVASLRPALASSAAAEADQTAAAAFPPRRVRAPLEHVSDDAASQLPAASSLKPNRLASHQRDHAADAANAAAADAANAAAADAAANAAATSPAASRLRAVKRSAPLPAAELDTTETDNDATPSPAVLAAIDAAKSHVFKIAAPLRPLQAEAIAAAVTNRDVLLISGTGSGKSLTYLLPASLTPASEGCTVVVSPLVALIADQLKYCQGLASRSLVARALTGSVPLVQQRSTLAMVREGRVNVLFITPEQFVYKSSVLDALAARPPKRLVFDEAHCVVSWGESFRPSYMEACVKLRAALPDTRWTLATATAPPQVRSALVDLFPRPPLVLAASSTVRENLSYAIVPKPDFGVAQRIAALCGAAASLVYVMTKADADKLHAELAALGVNAVMYHAGMKLAEKRRAQEQWLAGKASMLIATPAFGMGVHHPAVRFVVHHSMPLSLSDYAQASGRCVRSVCIARAGQRVPGMLTRFAAEPVATANPRTALFSSPARTTRAPSGSWITRRATAFNSARCSTCARFGFACAWPLQSTWARSPGEPVVSRTAKPARRPALRPSRRCVTKRRSRHRRRRRLALSKSPTTLTWRWPWRAQRRSTSRAPRFALACLFAFVVGALRFEG